MRLTKSVIDDLPVPSKDTVYWDAGLPGFGVKVTPKGRKVFIVMYRLAGAGSMHSRTLCAGHGRESLVFGRIVSNPTFYFEASIRASVKKRRHRDGLCGVGNDRGSRRRPIASLLGVDQVTELFRLLAAHFNLRAAPASASRLLR